MADAAEKLDLGAVAARLAATRIGVRERRRFRRLPLAMAGRMLDPLGREQDCRTGDISPGDVRIAAPLLPDIGDRVVIYLDGLGRVTGRVARRCGEGEAAIVFDSSAHKREKLAEQLTLAINRDLAIDAAPRQAEPAQITRVEAEDGAIYEGETLDFSIAGITLRTAKRPPPLGAWVRVGGVYGRVARLIEGGFAIDFEQPGGPSLMRR